MPEGDTVYLAGRRLHDEFAGRTITSSDFRIAQLATIDLRGTNVREVRSRGKHLLFRFADGKTLHTHFRMDGSWHLYRAGDPWRGGPQHEIRIVLQAEDRVAVGYRLHDVALLPTGDEDRLIGHLGPDICADEWDEGEAVTRLRAASQRSIATALVDQRIIAGIGNIYRCEAMFLSGLAPNTPVAAMNEDTVRDVIAVARQLLMRNRDRASQSTTGDERRAHYVYGRWRGNCYRCNTKLRTLTADATEQSPAKAFTDRGRSNEQTVFWCPTCQPERT